MGYIEDAERLIAHVKQIKQTGASATQEQANPPADIGIFADGYPEWVADNGLEKLNHISYYPKTGIVYQCINPIQRYAHYTPDIATNNYNPYPSPDNEGIYPYVNGMTVWRDMVMRYNDELYKCILPSGTYKLIYTPDQVPSVMEKIEQE